MRGKQRRRQHCRGLRGVILVQSFCESVEDENSDGDHSDGDAELYEDELVGLHERELWAALCLRTAR